MSGTKIPKDSLTLRSLSTIPQYTSNVYERKHREESMTTPVDSSDLLSNEESPKSPDPAKATSKSLYPNGGEENFKTKRNIKQNAFPGIMRSDSNVALNSYDPYARTHYAQAGLRTSRASLDLEANSQVSRSSQETEEDVCFPMFGEHVRINGIDFDEIEDFIREECETHTKVPDLESSARDRLLREEKDAVATSFHSQNDISGLLKSSSSIVKRNLNSSSKLYSNAFKQPAHEYKTNSGNLYEPIGNEDGVEVPSRFSFFHSTNERTVHAADIPSLIPENSTSRDLFKNGDGIWWLDCTCPTDSEMKVLAKAFGIHPLTAEDVRMQEPREKVELFKNYYFVCFNTLQCDVESEDYLEPINVYLLVFQDGILTFHFSPIPHPANVRRRVRQLRDFVEVSADWICYAMIDDITDAFAPIITSVEYEADAIDVSVYDALTANFSSMLRTIGKSRRKVMTLMRLLSNKADVIRMFAKRCQDEVHCVTSDQEASCGPRRNPSGVFSESVFGPSSHSGPKFGPPPGAPSTMAQQTYPIVGRSQPRADIALYLGDIQDHVVTMFQNLAAYEKIFSRSHANYLAQLQVESFKANLKVTKILGSATMVGTIFLPLNVIASLFGMNVKVLGEGEPGWFWGILGFIILVGVASFLGVRVWLRRIKAKEQIEADSGKSVRSISQRVRRKDVAKSVLSFPNRYD